VLGEHSDAIRCVRYSSDLGKRMRAVFVELQKHITNLCDVGCVYSGSWDKYVGVWDPRAREKCIGKYLQADKILSMDIAKDKLVIGMGHRHVYIYDTRNMKETLQRRESSLKFQTRCIRSFPNGEGQWPCM
jgi:cell cycle arrest protein BUB3